jgi:hypothetical protein
MAWSILKTCEPYAGRLGSAFDGISEPSKPEAAPQKRGILRLAYCVLQILNVPSVD